jgi:hypothetical protein
MPKTDFEVTLRLLKHELDDWRPFSDSLHADERQGFRDMLEKVWRYSEAIQSSGKTYLVEPFFLSILLTQEERIAFLQDELVRLKEEIEERKPKAGF